MEKLLNPYGSAEFAGVAAKVGTPKGIEPAMIVRKNALTMYGADEFVGAEAKIGGVKDIEPGMVIRKNAR